MKKWLLIVSSLLFLGIIGGYVGYTFVYNKPHTNYETADPDFTLESQTLFTSYTNERAEAEKKYNGKVLEISGVLTAIEHPESMTIIVFALQEGMFGAEGIRCTLLPHHKDKAETLLPGSRVRIKGYCAGYNDTDVILEKCSIL